MPNPSARARALAALMGAAIGLILITIGFQVLRGPTHRVAVPPSVEDVPAGTLAASRSAYVHAPWFGRFDGYVAPTRGQLVAFSATCADSSAGQEPNCGMARHNSHGFRMPEYTVAHPPDTTRIVIIGDSYTWGDGSRLEDVYHRRLQARFDGDGAKVEIIALGVNGSSLFEHFTALRAHAERLNPDLVIAQLCGNDLEYRRNVRLFRSRDWQPGVAERVAIFSALKTLWLEPPAYETNEESFEWRLFRAAVRSFADWRAASGTPVGFVAFSAIGRPSRPSTFARPRAVDSADVLARMQRAVREAGLPVFDTWEAFQTRAADARPILASENGHYGPVANQIVGDALFDKLTGGHDWLALPKATKPAGAEWAAERVLREQAARDWLANHQDYDRQKALYEALLAIHPDNPWLVNNLALVLRDKGERARAVPLFERLAVLAPDFAAPWHDLYLAAADADTRRQMLMRMLDAVPDDPDAAEQLAGLLARTGAAAAACGCYRRAADHARYAGQFERALDGLRESRCEASTKPICP